MNIRPFLPVALVLALGVGGAVAINHVTVAYAESTVDASPMVPTSGSASPGSDVPRETVGSGPNQTGSGSAIVLAGPAVTTLTPPAVVVTEPIITTDDVSLLTKLWRSGSILSIASVLAFIGFTTAMKLDRKRAFLWSCAIAGSGVLYECVQRGATPTGSMGLIAISTALALYVKGPSGDPPKA